MPREQVDRISAAVARAQKQPAIVEQLTRQGIIPLIMGPDAVRAYRDAEITKYVRLARAANIQPT
jgi:tripartite-type tricarboxylate transporter receptor subunit TctC